MIRYLVVPCVALAAAIPAAAQETLLLRQPSVSDRHIAFAQMDAKRVAVLARDADGGATRPSDTVVQPELCAR